MENLKEYIIEGIFDIDDNINKMDKSIKLQIKQFLKDNFKGHSNCKISRNPNSDGKYEVSCSKDIEVKNKNITSFTNGMFIWVKVNGGFDCSDCNSLTSLEGAPKEIGRSFYCVGCNSLQSLKGAPKEVGGDFYCHSCHSLTSLEGAQEVVGSFSCRGCKLLTSLEGAPKEVGMNFNCCECDSLISLELI